MILLLIPAVALADGANRSCETEELFSLLRERSDIFIDDGAYEVNSSLIFYQFRQDLESGADRVEFEFERQGERLATEEVVLIDNDPSLGIFEKDLAASSGTVVGVLMNEPSHRARLRLLAEGGVTLDVGVRLNGEEVDLLTFGELVAQSEELRQNLPQPHASSSRLVFPAAVPAFDFAPSIIPTKGACEDGCLTQRSLCMSDCNDLPVPARIQCRRDCIAEYNQCIDGCGGQTGCTPSTSTSTTTNLISETFLSLAECLVSSIFSVDWYRFVRRTYQVTTTTTTINADCSQTVTTSNSFPTLDCWLWDFPGPCLHPINTFNICI